jgi:two-component system NarL family sensor kinase
VRPAAALLQAWRRLTVADERRFALEAVAAEEEARRRIAEDLHDGPLQTLLAAKQDLIEASPGRAGVTRALAGVDDGIDGLRRAVGTLHPVTIERDGLTGALTAIAAEAERRGAFRCDLEIEDDAAGPHEQVILSLARELLANAAKHSGAGRVLVTVDRDRGWLRLEVADDGRGFDPTGLPADPCDGHIGLAAAERRARALGGSLAIAARPDAGTAVSVRLPVEGSNGRDPAAAAAGGNGRP